MTEENRGLMFAAQNQYWAEMARKFKNRRQAGQILAERLRAFQDHERVVALGLPRGGVPVAFEVAKELRAPLDIFLARKLGVPGHEELAMGAIASGGVRVLNPSVVESLRIPPEVIERAARAEQANLEQRERLYRAGRAALELRGAAVILVDDGLATGTSMRAALAALKEHQPERVIVAVPVAARETCRELENEGQAVVCVQTPAPFYAVGLWYDDFSQTTDEEVQELLAAAGRMAPAEAHA